MKNRGLVAQCDLMRSSWIMKMATELRVAKSDEFGAE